MEQLPTWLEAAVTAAGMTTVYNADDWELALPGTRTPAAADPTEPPPAIH